MKKPEKGIKIKDWKYINLPRSKNISDLIDTFIEYRDEGWETFDGVFGGHLRKTRDETDEEFNERLVKYEEFLEKQEQKKIRQELSRIKALEKEKLQQKEREEKEFALYQQLKEKYETFQP